MPTVLRVDGFEVMIFLPDREHGPAHVHVYKDETEVILLLGSEASGVTVRRILGMRRSHIIAAVQIVEEHADELRAHWRRYHG